MKRTQSSSFSDRSKIQEEEDTNGDTRVIMNHCKNFEDRLIPWTPTNYTCSFCRREFRSAQALGGHMNFHRRDRARFRQIPSWLFQPHEYHIPIENPNPNFSSSSSSSTTSEV